MYRLLSAQRGWECHSIQVQVVVVEEAPARIIGVYVGFKITVSKPCTVLL